MIYCISERLAGEVEVEGEAVGGVGGGVGGGGDEGGVDLVVEVGGDGEAARQHVACLEVDRQCAGARCGLGVGCLDAAYEGLGVGE